MLGLLLWLPGILSLPALDRDESRFAQSSRQMLDSGNLVDIRFGQVPRYKKPVGIYWLQAATTAIAGLPNIEGDHTASGPIACRRCWAASPRLADGWWALAFVAGSRRCWRGCLMGFTVLLTAEATIATTDAVLLACILGAQGVLLRVYRAAKEGATVPGRMVLWGWAALAVAILIKGPVAAGVTGATIFALLAWDWWEQRPRKAAVPAPAQEDSRRHIGSL